MLTWLADIVAELWAVNEEEYLPQKVDLIVIVSIGVRRDGAVTKGVEKTTSWALYQQQYKYKNETPIAFGAFAGNGEGESEGDWKSHRIRFGKFVGKVMTTIEECLAFKAAYPDAKKVIFVTEQAHSRRARIVWRCLWPEADIYIISMPLSTVIDSDAVMWPYRRAWTALAFQALPTPLYKLAAALGPKWLMKLSRFHQPVATA